MLGALTLRPRSPERKMIVTEQSPIGKKNPLFPEEQGISAFKFNYLPPQPQPQPPFLVVDSSSDAFFVLLELHITYSPKKIEPKVKFDLGSIPAFLKWFIDDVTINLRQIYH